MDHGHSEAHNTLIALNVLFMPCGSHPQFFFVAGVGPNQISNWFVLRLAVRFEMHGFWPASLFPLFSLPLHFCASGSHVANRTYAMLSRWVCVPMSTVLP